jgi:hypothetical protein
MWEVEGTDQFADWYANLDESLQIRVDAAISWLEEKGPALDRPFVDTIKTSRHGHMKELRPRGGSLRILFVFDPRRTAILLLGGDKTDRWQEWYKDMIPLADKLYDDYLVELTQEGSG